MKVKTSELTGPALDWAVATINGDGTKYGAKAYSTAWAHGGPIIERELITVQPVVSPVGWIARIQRGDSVWEGPTPLIAACRCHVASNLGDEVDVPEELV